MNLDLDGLCMLTLTNLAFLVKTRAGFGNAAVPTLRIPAVALRLPVLESGEIPSPSYSAVRSSHEQSPQCDRDRA